MSEIIIFYSSLLLLLLKIFDIKICWHTRYDAWGRRTAQDPFLHDVYAREIGASGSEIAHELVRQKRYEHGAVHNICIQ